MRRKLGIGDNDLVVLFVGNAKPQKKFQSDCCGQSIEYAPTFLR